MKIPLVRDAFSLLCPPVFPAGWGGKMEEEEEEEGEVMREKDY